MSNPPSVDNSANLQQVAQSQAQVVQSRIETTGINMQEISRALAEATLFAQDIADRLEEKRNNKPERPDTEDQQVLANYQNELAQWNNDIAGMQSDITEVNNKVKDLQGELTRLEALQNQLTTVAMQQAKGADRAILEDEAKNVGDVADDLRTQLSALQNKVEAAGAELLSVTTRETTVRAEIQASVPLSAGGAATLSVSGDFQTQIRQLSVALDRAGAATSGRAAAGQLTGLLEGGASAATYTPASPQEQELLDNLRQTAATALSNTDPSDPAAVTQTGNDLSSRIANAIENGGIGGVDVAALVQYVLMEAYTRTTEDMYVFAQKVKHFNGIKDGLRAELAAANKHLAEGVDGDNDALTNGDFTQTNMLSGAYGTVGTPVTQRNADGTVDAGNASKVNSSKESLEAYIDGLQEKLSTVGDDAQIANLDLQQFVQKQQQTLQMMSNIYKLMHDTALSIIRKIG